ncbi:MULTISPECIES: hypothetical protein [Bartonella]|uniref:DUF748 domain-containing protein n=1 Tax=Bartonella chomelii TaxID=236402 RepID=A0ABR6E4M2_9HYPH|nr:MULTISPECIES: hypothetical protein [Bartonella]MBA9082590.1 hypothetical protein [Bartonella chomelii]
MINFNSWYRNNLKYWLTYIIGFVAILIIIVIGGFYMAKPHLDSFVQKEIARRSINAETSEVSILGKINLINVTLPTPADTSLKIGSISGRPPIAFIPGAFTLYDIDLTYKNVRLQIPKISINNVSLKNKDATITSSFLQSFMRIDISSINAPDISLFIEDENKPTERINIKNFQLSNLQNGRIHSVGIKDITTNISFAKTAADSTKKLYLTVKGNPIKAHNIDVGYAYSIISDKNNVKNQGETVIGPITLGNVVADIFEGEEKNTSFSFRKFETSGLKIQPLDQPFKKLIQDYLSAKKANNQTAQNAILVNGLSAITSIDAKIDKVIIDTPQIKTNLESFQLKSDQWQQAIPENLLLSLNGLSILPKKMERKNLDFLKNTGFEYLDVSGKLDISYNEKERVLSLNAMSFNVQNIGSGKISARVIDVDKTFFSGQKDAMIAASQNLGISEIDIYYTDAGLIDKIFSYLAQSLNDNKHDLKQELYDNFYLIVTQSPKILLKNHDEAENISKALGNFARNPQTLKIKIAAKDNKGLTASDLEAALQNNLSAVLNKMSLTVKNEASH